MGIEQEFKKASEDVTQLNKRPGNDHELRCGFDEKDIVKSLYSKGLQFHLAIYIGWKRNMLH